MRRRITCMLFALAVGAAAWAQPLAAQRRAPPHRGFWVAGGGGVGWASLTTCDGCDRSTTPGATFFVGLGGTIGDHWRAGVRVDGWRHRESGPDLHSGITTWMLTGGYNPHDEGIYVDLGAGYARFTSTGTDATSGQPAHLQISGFAARAGAGYQIRVARRLAISPYASFERSFAGDVKVNGFFSADVIDQRYYQLGLSFLWQ